MEDEQLTGFEEIQKYLKEEVEKLNKYLGVSSIEEGLKKLEELEKNKKVALNL